MTITIQIYNITSVDIIPSILCQKATYISAQFSYWYLTLRFCDVVWLWLLHLCLRMDSWCSQLHATLAWGPFQLWFKKVFMCYSIWANMYRFKCAWDVLKAFVTPAIADLILLRSWKSPCCCFVLPCLLCIFFVIFCSFFIYESTHWWLTRLLLKISAIQSYHHQCSSSYFILPSFWLKWFVQMNNRKSWRLIFAAIMSSLSTVFPYPKINQT